MVESQSRSGAEIVRQQGPSRSRFMRYGRRADGSYQLGRDSIPSNVRLLGSGQVGGKARGLIFVMNHLAGGTPLTEYDHLIRLPDSLVVTTEVFEEFMDKNGIDNAVLSRCQEEIGPDELRKIIVSSDFPSSAREPLRRFLTSEHRPLAVRSSSVMEDDVEHSFAGVYVSEFLSNTGSEEERLESLIHSIKHVYASTFDRDARAYRKRHGLRWQEEKMAVLIQNMIGSHYPRGLYYPLIGGVGYSLNFYPWSDRLLPEDGVVRLVVGVGTRAVGREYARVFSPKAPGLRPEGSDARAIVRYSQETVDVLDMEAGSLRDVRLAQLDNPLLREVCSVVDSEGVLSEPVSLLARGGRYVASFNRLIARGKEMPFTSLIHQLLVGLEGLFELAVDIEFAVDFGSGQGRERPPLFYLLQARPLGARPEHRQIEVPVIPLDTTLLACHQVLGNGMRLDIRHLLFVDPEEYRPQDAHRVARRVGRINQILEDDGYILIGPGRWGTTNPQLGVPVQYNEIAGASTIVEMATESFSPELSYGTHFYADMVAAGVLYLPLSEERGDFLNRSMLEESLCPEQYGCLKHYEFPDGLDVYADGKGKEGLIVVHS